jgi:hypothetical protein
MALEISTAGVTVNYAFETESGTRPETGYQRLPNIKATPDFNPEPSSLEVTDLSDTEWKRYIPGVKDPGGALGFTANNTNEFQAAWQTLCYLSELAREDELATWFEIKVPGLENSFYFAAIPSSLGVIGMEPDAVAEVTAYLSPNEVHGWDTASTDPAVYITPVTTQFVTTANSPLDVTVITDAEATLSAESSDTEIVTVSAGTGKITLTKVAAGEAYVIITTDDPEGYSEGATVIKVVVS